MAVAMQPAELQRGYSGCGSAGDVEDLYRRLATRLERIVRCGVRAPDPVIEDACQVAWTRLIHHAERVRRDTALSWLATTALHEAFRLLRCSAREPSLELALESGEAALHPTSPRTEDVFEERDRINRVGELPERQQRLLWLQALGLSYGEIAAHEGCTVRTVERQLHKARDAMRREP